MSKIKLQFDIPVYAAKHIEKVNILFAVNPKNEEYSVFVPMEIYLKSLSRIEELSSDSETK